jgi:hypothetical protein
MFGLCAVCGVRCAVCCVLCAVLCCAVSCPAVCYVLSAVCCLLSAVCCLLSAVCCLLSAVYSVLRAACCGAVPSHPPRSSPASTPPPPPPLSLSPQVILSPSEPQDHLTALMHEEDVIKTNVVYLVGSTLIADDLVRAGEG